MSDFTFWFLDLLILLYSESRWLLINNLILNLILFRYLIIHWWHTCLFYWRVFVYQTSHIIWRPSFSYLYLLPWRFTYYLRTFFYNLLIIFFFYFIVLLLDFFIHFLLIFINLLFFLTNFLFHFYYIR